MLKSDYVLQTSLLIHLILLITLNFIGNGSVFLKERKYGGTTLIFSIFSYFSNCGKFRLVNDIFLLDH